MGGGGGFPEDGLSLILGRSKKQGKKNICITLTTKVILPDFQRGNAEGGERGVVVVVAEEEENVGELVDDDGGGGGGDYHHHDRDDDHGDELLLLTRLDEMRRDPALV